MAYREFVNIQIIFYNRIKFINIGIEPDIFIENMLEDLIITLIEFYIKD